ncbi:MAG: histidine phosphatase family protein [Actinobacteria bacterium]|nr:histidine phosphatase family protein [Actinomycetota bacterium]
MSRILIVRHGESTWNAARRWQGHADAPLSEAGWNQARAAASSLVGKFDGAWASDLSRAYDTAVTLAAAVGLTEVCADARLRERAAGAWEGHTRDEIEAQWPGYLSDGRRPEGYEDDDAITGRVLPALTEIAMAHRQALVVAHGGVIRAIERYLTNADSSIPNLGGRWLSYDDCEFRMLESVELVPADVPTNIE